MRCESQQFEAYIERLTLLNLQSLEHRCLIHDLILCFNIIHNRIAITHNVFVQLSEYFIYLFIYFVDEQVTTTMET